MADSGSTVESKRVLTLLDGFRLLTIALHHEIDASLPAY